MKVGIIVYSNTGNTLSVAQKLEQVLKTAGHEVIIKKVETVNNNPRSSSPIELKSAPDVSLYDMVVFASAVHAFSLAPVMKHYLSGVQNLSYKKVYCFVTQYFKKAWMGGNNAVRQIAAACKAKGADIISSGVVNWSASNRNNQIDEIVNRLSDIK